MGELTVKLDADAFEPGGPITGVVQWKGPVNTLAVVLRWETSGKGTKDTQIVSRAVIALPDPQATEARFELTAPEQPFTFSGKLISLAYYLRIEDTDPAHGHFETEIVIAPGGREVRLAGA